jgi:hypothetical protein
MPLLRRLGTATKEMTYYEVLAREHEQPLQVPGQLPVSTYLNKLEGLS